MAPSALVITFGVDGNCSPFVGDGWSGPEPGHRWSEGLSSELALPPLPAAPHRLTLTVWPLFLEGVTQTLALEWNGVALGEPFTPKGGEPVTLDVPAGLVRTDSANLLVSRQPRAQTPKDHKSSNGDGRMLAFAWSRLEIAPCLPPQPLAEIEQVYVRDFGLAKLFEGLGRESGVGAFQTRIGLAPQGLLAFAEIPLHGLRRALLERFSGLDDLSALEIAPAGPDGEWMARHAHYGFSYPTGRREGELRLGLFRGKEARRVQYQGWRLIEDIKSDARIFVRRCEDVEAKELHSLLCALNPHARLLTVQEGPAGRVERMGGNLYRAYVSDGRFEEWMKLASTLYVHQAEMGRL